MKRTDPIRVGAFGFLGLGNLGNEGSFTAVLEHLRSLDPAVEVRCFAGDPATVTLEHGVPATRLMSYRSARGSSGRSEQARKAWGRVADVPRIWRLVGEVDVVVVPGMGVLEPALQDTAIWGLPYWMFLAALFSRLRRRPFVLMCVGAGVPRNRWVRLYFRWTLRLASYASFRDKGSREAADQLRGRARPGTLATDVAFGLSSPGHADPVPGRLVVGVMAPHSREGAQDAVARYTAKVSAAVVRLLDRGHSIRLVIGDLADRELADRLADTVRGQRPSADEALLTVSDADTLPGLMVEMSRAEAVIASRYHNLVCALMVPRPAISLGYAEKNAELLEAFGLRGYDQPMGDFDVELLDLQVKELCQRRVDLEPDMSRALERMRAALRVQYREFDEKVLGVAR